MYLCLQIKSVMEGKGEIILITINGYDRPGVTAALTEILARNNAVILDIGQADIHSNLSLGILFQSNFDTLKHVANLSLHIHKHR